MERELSEQRRYRIGSQIKRLPFGGDTVKSDPAQLSVSAYAGVIAKVPIKRFIEQCRENMLRQEAF